MVRSLKPGDKVIAIGVPYSWRSSKATVISSPEPKSGGGWCVGIRYWYFGTPHRDVLSVQRVVKIKEKRMKLSKSAIVTGAVLFFIFFMGGWLAGNYNSLVAANEDVDNSWSKVETQYQRRFDLIGNVVESVKGSQLQEQKVFGDIANARKQYQSATSTDEKAQAASNIETNVALIPRLQEAYPELKSNQNVQMLMKELAGTEGQVATTRDKFNDTVTNYNKNVQRFPKNVFASLFGFKERAQFKAAQGADKAPQVKFTN